MSKPISYLRKIAVLIIGIPLFILGVILIPLPGPGLLVCFAALFILSLEFEWAEKQRDKAKAQLQKIFESAKNRS